MLRLVLATKYFVLHPRTTTALPCLKFVGFSGSMGAVLNMKKRIQSANQRAKIFVVLKPGETATAEELIEWCRQGLARYKVPKYVEFRDELPKTLVGKILRRELVEEEAAKGNQ